MSTNKHTFTPRLESLEQRSLMAWNIFAVGGVLHALGDGANDTLHLYDSGKGVVAGVASGSGPFAFAGIKDIVINAGAGNDDVHYHLFGNLEAHRVRKVTALLGAGDDVFTAGFNNGFTGLQSDLLAKSLLQMSVQGQAGNDDLFIDATGGVDMLGGTMKVGFFGNDGNDRIGMSYQGRNLNGGVSFFGYGGAGNDLLRASMVADPGSVAPHPGGFRALMYGETGDDALFVNVTAPATVSTVNMLIDGGSGKDQGAGNIPASKIINCEF